MLIKIVGVIKPVAQAFESFCRKGSINIALTSDDNDCVDITIHTSEEQLILSTLYYKEAIMIHTTLYFGGPAFVIHTTDFEKLVII